MFKKGEHVQDKDGHTGHITAVITGHIFSDLIIEVQWDDRPWGKREWWHERHLVHDYPADVRSAARFEEHRKAYNEAKAAAGKAYDEAMAPARKAAK